MKFHETNPDFSHQKSQELLISVSANKKLEHRNLNIFENITNLESSIFGSENGPIIRREMTHNKKIKNNRAHGDK